MQGNKIAIRSALNNPKIYKVGYAAGNPLGRINQLIREERKWVDNGLITPKEGQKEIENPYQMWREINMAPNAVSTTFGAPNKTWTSFSIPILDDILKIRQPLYVVYGTADITSTFCDLLPIYFIRQHKNNMTPKPYLGLEHNFFEVGKDVAPITQKAIGSK